MERRPVPPLPPLCSPLTEGEEQRLGEVRRRRIEVPRPRHPLRREQGAGELGT
jgi:hypothetical protein